MTWWLCANSMADYLGYISVLGIWGNTDGPASIGIYIRSSLITCWVTNRGSNVSIVTRWNCLEKNIRISNIIKYPVLLIIILCLFKKIFWKLLFVISQNLNKINSSSLREESFHLKLKLITILVSFFFFFILSRKTVWFLIIFTVCHLITRKRYHFRVEVIFRVYF